MGKNVRGSKHFFALRQKSRAARKILRKVRKWNGDPINSAMRNENCKGMKYFAQKNKRKGKLEVISVYPCCVPEKGSFWIRILFRIYPKSLWTTYKINWSILLVQKLSSVIFFVRFCLTEEMTLWPLKKKMFCLYILIPELWRFHMLRRQLLLF